MINLFCKIGIGYQVIGLCYDSAWLVVYNSISTSLCSAQYKREENILTQSVGSKVLFKSIGVHLSLIYNTTCVVDLTKQNKDCMSEKCEIQIIHGLEFVGL